MCPIIIIFIDYRISFNFILLYYIMYYTYNLYRIRNFQCYSFHIILLKYYSITPQKTSMFFFFVHQSKSKIWISKKIYGLILITPEPKV